VPGKTKCKLCGDSVRFALRHLKEKHPETLKDRDVIKLNVKDNGKIFQIIPSHLLISQIILIAFTVYNSCSDVAC
jgi:hypothetical protein